MHCLEFALTPRFYDPHYLAIPAPGGTTRKAPNLDREVIIGVLKAFEKIAENDEEMKLLREQFATFHMRKGVYEWQQLKQMHCQWIQLIGGQHMRQKLQT